MGWVWPGGGVQKSCTRTGTRWHKVPRTRRAQVTTVAGRAPLRLFSHTQVVGRGGPAGRRYSQSQLYFKDFLLPSLPWAAGFWIRWPVTPTGTGAGGLAEAARAAPGSQAVRGRSSPKKRTQ
jgi:hypothetical protein